MKRLFMLFLIAAIGLLGTTAAVEARYHDNGNGTVTDTSTGLMWQQATPRGTMTWDAAGTYCSGLNLGGYTDWFLPFQVELTTLVDMAYHPTINPNVFPDTWAFPYWSATVTTSGEDAQRLSFDDGTWVLRPVEERYYVRCVRTYSDGTRLGSLTITIEPERVLQRGAKWRRVGSSVWHDSGDTENNVPVGNYTVEFRAVTNWTRPDNLRVAIREGVLTRATATYIAGVSNYGQLSVTIHPEAARDAGARWRRAGTTTWYSSGDTEPNVPSGSQVVEFKSITNWITPENISVNINIGETARLTGIYVYEARYTDNNNGTITDTRTGLMWQQNTAPGAMIWDEAAAYCQNLNLADYTGWELPARQVLGTLVDTRYVPTISSAFFPNTWQFPYWSATGTGDSRDHLNFRDATWGSGSTASRYYVRCVLMDTTQTFGSLTVTIEPPEARTAGAQWRRTGTETWFNSGSTENNIRTGEHTVEFRELTGWNKPPNQTVTIAAEETTQLTATYIYGARFQDNGDGTVTDTSTGLMWQKATAPGLMTHEQAVTYCNRLALGGYTNWILPTRSHLESLVDLDFTPTIDPAYFPDTWNSHYWTSTGYTLNYSYYTISFNTGSVQFRHKDESYYVRAVRAASPALVITIEPEAARAAGAQWRYVGDTSWWDSGVIDETVTTGEHTIEFRELEGWIRPENQTVTVGTAQTVRRSVTYRHLVTASAGPGGRVTPMSQAVEPGSTATFTVSPAGGYEPGPVSGTCPAGTFSGNQYTTGVITGNCSVSFSFNQIPYTADQLFPDTGQAHCYNNTAAIPCPAPGQPFYGQDAQYQPRLLRAYTKLGQGGAALPDNARHVDQGGPWIMTQDRITGLIWEVKTSANRHAEYTWENAAEVFIAGLNRQNFGGFSDWRLPTATELASLVHGGRTHPAIDTNFFPYTTSTPYWTVSQATGQTSSAAHIFFGQGNVGQANIQTRHQVRAVRGGQVGTRARLVSNRNGTVTDPVTGLMWQQISASEPFTWEEALAYAEGLTLAGYSDWRLPNRNELQTLASYTRQSPAIVSELFGETRSAAYWTSTTSRHLARQAWLVHFASANVYADEKTGTAYVRLVRGGESNVRPVLIGSWPEHGLYTYDPTTGRWQRIEAEARQIAVGDLTGDGVDDLALVHNDGLWLRYSVSRQRVKLSDVLPISITIADMTGNGRQEIVGSWSEGLYYYDPATREWVRLADAAQQIAAGELTGDGRNDLVGSWNSAGVYMYSGAARRWYPVTPTPALALTAADLDGNGLADIVGSWPQGVYHFNRTTSDWSLLVNQPTDLLAAGDLTGNRRHEIAVAWDDGLWIYHPAQNRWQHLTTLRPSAIGIGRMLIE